MPGAWAMLALIALLFGTLLLMSNATADSTRFSELFSALLVVNVLGIAGLGGLIVWNLGRLRREVRERRPGARLAARMIGMLAVISITPLVVVFLFSLQFLHRGIDSWFDVRVESALKDALELGRTALDGTMRERLKQTERLAAELGGLTPEQIARRLNEAFPLSGAIELALVSGKGGIVAAISDTPTLTPSRPDSTILLQVRQTRSYIGLDPIGEGGLYIRVVVLLPDVGDGLESHFLQALYPVAERMGVLADNVESAFAQYRTLVYLRRPLKIAFTLTLGLVVVVSILAAVWAAIFSARRLSAPLQEMAALTRAVAAGDFETRIDSRGSDDVSFLVDSFNRMTQELARARDETRRSQQQVEAQRQYLEAVLSRLSSGVLTLDPSGRLHTFNKMSEQILGVSLAEAAGRPLADLVREWPHLTPLMELLARQATAQREDWREEVAVFGPNGRQVLLCRGTVLPGGISAGRLPAPGLDPEGEPARRGTGDAGAPAREGTPEPGLPARLRTDHLDGAGAARDGDGGDGEVGAGSGHVIVFDDVTRLIEAQRNEAWSEVARRLAHEIKNPLTPIQLSAERLRLKYLPRLESRDGEAFDRLTRTIVQQVESMKAMVNAFSSYARSPSREPVPCDLDTLIRDVAELYRSGTREGGAAPGGEGPGLAVTLEPGLPPAVADPGRMRQLLHNLIKNALEAQEAAGGGKGATGGRPAQVEVSARLVEGSGQREIELAVLDNGPGIPEELRERLFEPYVTTKKKGTGLGLAIVRKIVEEHGGRVWVENRPEGGARVVVRLPADASPDAGPSGSGDRASPSDARSPRDAPGQGHDREVS